MTSSLQIKPRSFGEVFWQVVPLASALFAGGIYLSAPDGFFDNHPDRVLVPLLVLPLFFGIVAALITAYFYQGESIVKECDDPKKALATLAVRLAENRYNLETQTETLHTFKPPLQYWIGGRVYIISEGLTLRIVGPTYVLKKLRNV